MRTLGTWFEARCDGSVTQFTLCRIISPSEYCGNGILRLPKTDVITFVISNSLLHFFDQSQKDDKLSVNTVDPGTE